MMKRYKVCANFYGDIVPAITLIAENEEERITIEADLKARGYDKVWTKRVA